MAQKHVTKWYATPSSVTFGTGSTLTIGAGATIASTGWTNSTTVASMTCTGACTVGTTLAVTGNFSVGTTKFTANATSGAVVAAGNITTGVPASGKALILCPSDPGTGADPGVNNMFIFTDGSDLFARRHLDYATKKSKLNGTFA